MDTEQPSGLVAPVLAGVLPSPPTWISATDFPMCPRPACLQLCGDLPLPDRGPQGLFSQAALSSGPRGLIVAIAPRRKGLAGRGAESGRSSPPGLASHMASWSTKQSFPISGQREGWRVKNKMPQILTAPWYQRAMLRSWACWDVPAGESQEQARATGSDHSDSSCYRSTRSPCQLPLPGRSQ